MHLSTGALRDTKPEVCLGLSVCICRQVHLHLSTDALRQRIGFQKSKFLSVSVDRRYASVDRCTQGYKT
ncbi:hypothetical protein Taro_044021 [Colocasia esculenta]|uniref:Uncharacterized protein n=1 Tax=Colocasia esculenta TaxID=4460 RepID=A0A843WX85_COLES|nr:hypothetical protein [Colocasia esculenta]